MYREKVYSLFKTFYIQQNQKNTSFSVIWITYSFGKTNPYPEHHHLNPTYITIYLGGASKGGEVAGPTPYVDVQGAGESCCMAGQLTNLCGKKLYLLMNIIQCFTMTFKVNISLYFEVEIFFLGCY